MADLTTTNASPNAPPGTSDTPPIAAPPLSTSADIAMTDVDTRPIIPEPSLTSETTINRDEGDPSSSGFPLSKNVNIRQYLNEKVCPSLTAGCKLLVQDPEHLPQDPLRILGEFFLERHAEMVAAQKGKELHMSRGSERPNGETATS